MTRKASPDDCALQTTALIQGAYYLAAGLWPLVHLRSFERVLGPKEDDWLVKTVGALAAVMGTTLIVGARERGGRAATAALGLGGAVAFGAVDVWYALRGRISRVYLLDAVAEAAFAAAWTRALVSRPAGARSPA